MAGRTPTLPAVTALAPRLRAALKHRGRTQKDVAQALRISPNTMTNIMSGKTTDLGANMIYALALELDVSVDFLFGLCDDLERRRPGTKGETP
jgi:transcriptional regulator with XRE-family HTH domain